MVRFFIVMRVRIGHFCLIRQAASSEVRSIVSQHVNLHPLIQAISDKNVRFIYVIKALLQPVTRGGACNQNYRLPLASQALGEAPE